MPQPAPSRAGPGADLPLRPRARMDAAALALKVTKSGTYAVRRTGKFRATLNLGERADLTITATARKNSRTRARTILTTTRKRVAAGEHGLTLSLKRSVRASLRKGETVTVTVKARYADGNVTSRSATAKVL